MVANCGSGEQGRLIAATVLSCDGWWVVVVAVNVMDHNDNGNGVGNNYGVNSINNKDGSNINNSNGNKDNDKMRTTASVALERAAL